MYLFYRLNLLLLLSVLCSPGILLANSPISISLLSEVNVKNTQLTLGDIALISAADTEKVMRLQAVKLGTTPRPGNMTVVNQPLILSKIRHQTPDLLPLLEWHSDQKSKVWGTGIEYDSQKLIQLAEDTLYRELEKHYQQFTVTPVGIFKTLRLPTGNISLKATLQHAQPKKRMLVWVDIYLDEKHYQSLPVWFAVAAQKTVLVNKQPLQALQTITAQDVEYQTVDITAVQGRVITDMNSINHVRARKHLPPGTVITSAIIEDIPLIAAGQKVSVLVKEGSVTLQVPGIALNDGQLEQVVTVENPSSGNQFRAQVIGLGKVRVN